MAATTSFPPEIVGLILDSYRSDRSQDDLTFLWTTLRHVSHHFKMVVEKMFMTEHVPKTRLHCSMKVRRYQAYYEPDVELEYVGVDPKFPGRAIFVLPSTASRPEWINAFFNTMKYRVAPGRMTNAVKARSGEPRLYENNDSIFLTQIRGCLGDCPLANVAIDRKKQEVSLEWRDLYTYFFGEKAKIKAIIESACVNNSELTSSPPASQPSMVAFEYHLYRLKPGLQALGRSDVEKLERFRKGEKAENELIQRRRFPIKSWRRDISETRRHPAMSLNDYGARHEADQRLNLNEEGDVQTGEVVEEQYATLARGREIFWKLTACDCCREMGIPCVPETTRICDTCLANGVRCEGALAEINRESGSPSILDYYGQQELLRSLNLNHSPGGGNHALQDYQIQRVHAQQQQQALQLHLMLDQKSKKCLLMVRQESSEPTYPPPRYPAFYTHELHGIHHPLQDYQMQLMLLEQQNKKRLLMARQESDSATQAGSGAASSSAGPSQPHSHLPN